MSQIYRGCNRCTMNRVSTLALATLGVFFGTSACGVLLAAPKHAPQKTFIGLLPQRNQAQVQGAFTYRQLIGENTCLGINVAPALHRGHSVGALLGGDIFNPHWNMNLQGVLPTGTTTLHTQHSVIPGFTMNLEWKARRNLSIGGVWVYHQVSGSHITDSTRGKLGAQLHYALKSGKSFGLQFEATQTKGSWKPSFGCSVQLKGYRAGGLRKSPMQQALQRELGGHSLGVQCRYVGSTPLHVDQRSPAHTANRTTDIALTSTADTSTAAHSRLPSSQSTQPVDTMKRADSSSQAEVLPGPWTSCTRFEPSSQAAPRGPFNPKLKIGPRIKSIGKEFVESAIPLRTPPRQRPRTRASTANAFSTTAGNDMQTQRPTDTAAGSRRAAGSGGWIWQETANKDSTPKPAAGFSTAQRSAEAGKLGCKTSRTTPEEQIAKLREDKAWLETKMDTGLLKAAMDNKLAHEEINQLRKETKDQFEAIQKASNTELFQSAQENQRISEGMEEQEKRISELEAQVKELRSKQRKKRKYEETDEPNAMSDATLGEQGAPRDEVKRRKTGRRSFSVSEEVYLNRSLKRQKQNAAAQKELQREQSKLKEEHTERLRNLEANPAIIAGGAFSFCCGTISQSVPEVFKKSPFAECRPGDLNPLEHKHKD